MESSFVMAATSAAAEVLHKFYQTLTRTDCRYCRWTINNALPSSQLSILFTTFYLGHNFLHCSQLPVFIPPPSSYSSINQFHPLLKLPSSSSSQTLTDLFAVPHHLHGMLCPPSFSPFLQSTYKPAHCLSRHSPHHIMNSLKVLNASFSYLFPTTNLTFPTTFIVLNGSSPKPA